MKKRSKSALNMKYVRTDSINSAQPESESIIFADTMPDLELLCMNKIKFPRFD